MEEIAPLLVIGFASLALGPFFIIFALLLFSTLREQQKCNASHDWPTVQALVKRSEVEQRQKKDRIKYRPKVEYEYSVQGKSFRSDRVHFGGRTPIKSEAEAQQFIAPYKLNSTVTAYYNPRKPSESVLMIGSAGPNQTATALFGGVLCVIAAIWLIIAASVL